MRLHASDAMASLLVLRGLRHQPDNAMIHHLQNQPVAALRFGIKLRNIALCVLTDVIDQTVKGEKNIPLRNRFVVRNGRGNRAPAKVTAVPIVLNAINFNELLVYRQLILRVFLP